MLASPFVRRSSPATVASNSLDSMRVATWNVNSIRTRVGRVVDWLGREDIDVLGMQEIKCKPEQFPYEAFAEAGYEVEVHGLNQWNGVAFASRLPMTEISRGFPGSPGFGKVDEAGDLPQEARALGVTVEDIRLWSLYVPNGRELDNPHYPYKLEWLANLATETRGWLAADPDLKLALMGDFNIAPLDIDVWDIAAFEGRTHVSQPERDAFTAFETAGLVDVFRTRGIEGYTYWDYQQLRFPRNEGMRIDFVLGSPAFNDLVTAGAIERNERKGAGPSDHVPLVVDLDVATGDDDDRPMIF
jgi:exodeoxyribonuclease-3